jgi:hypothetical protein
MDFCLADKLCTNPVKNPRENRTNRPLCEPIYDGEMDAGNLYFFLETYCARGMKMAWPERLS